MRKDHAQGDSWLEAELLQPDEQRKRIKSFVEKWHKAEYKWFESHVVAESYPLFSNVFDSAETMKAATDDELFNALCVEHSFFDRRRYYSGGLLGLKKAFFSQNDRDSINESLIFLVFGSEEIVMRMYRLIFDSGFKLKEFGKANVQELVGWKNKEDFPVINGRTTKVLRFFGFDVKQCQ